MELYFCKNVEIKIENCDNHNSSDITHKVNNMLKFLPLPLLLLTLSITQGCSNHAVFTYPLEPPIDVMNRTPPPLSIVVKPAVDLRNDHMATRSLYWAFVPLVPYGTAHYDRPEDADYFYSIDGFDSNLSEDLSQAVAKHMEHSGFVSRAVFDFGEETDEADLICEIEIHEASLDFRRLTYGLSILSYPLYLLGLPAAHQDLNMVLDLRLKKPDGRLIWAGHMHDHWRVSQGFYYNRGKDINGFAIMLQRNLEDMLSGVSFVFDLDKTDDSDVEIKTK